MQMINDDNWVLSVGTFLPMLGVIVLLVTPKANEAAIKMVALVTSIATVAVGAFTLFSFDFGKAGSMQFVVVFVEHGRHAACGDLQPRSHPVTGQPESLLFVDAHLANGYGRHVHCSRPHLVLCVL
jgi:hypothetical protein